MSKRVIYGVLAVAAILALSAAPAWSAQRALTKQNCEGAGGTFSSQRGVKYCVHVGSVYTVEGGPLGGTALAPIDATTAWRYTGSYRIDTTFAAVVTESQIGNRDVLTSTEDVQIDQSVVVTGCMKVDRIDVVIGIVLETLEDDVDQAECAALGLYPTL